MALGGVDGSPLTTYDYTWTEFGITPDQVPYLTGEIPVSRTWSATWDGTPTMSETAVPTGPTLASPEGFVRWNDNTWFSPDGLTWTASPLPDPTGTLQNVFPVDGGFVAFVANQDGRGARHADSPLPRELLSLVYATFVPSLSDMRYGALVGRLSVADVERSRPGSPRPQILRMQQNHSRWCGQAFRPRS